MRFTTAPLVLAFTAQVMAYNKYLDTAPVVLGEDFYSEAAKGVESQETTSDKSTDNDTDTEDTTVGMKNSSSDYFAPVTIKQSPTYTNVTYNATTNVTSYYYNGSMHSYVGTVDEIESKSVGSVFKSIGNFLCGLFVVCDIISTVANLGLEIAQIVESKSQQVKQEIAEDTKLVAIRV